MRLQRVLTITVAVLMLASVAAPQGNRSTEARLRAAMDRETVDGDLKAAIDGYKQVISQRGASRQVVAQALLRLGLAYEKQGDAEARKSYERLVREFADQTEVVQQARSRMAAGTAVAAGLTIRQICFSECSGVFSEDGRLNAFPRNGGGAVRDMATGQIQQFSKEPACCALFSPDNKRIAYGTGSPRATVIVNIDGTGRRTVSERGEPYDWSPDGTRILVGQAERAGQQGWLSWVRVADGTAQALPIARSVGFARISPDGRFVAFAGIVDATNRRNVFVMAADGSGETEVSASSMGQEPVGWSPDGKYLLYRQYQQLRAETLQTVPVVETLWTVPVTDGRVRGPAILVRQFDRNSILSMSRSGTLYYTGRSGTSDIYTASMDPVSGRVTSHPVAIPTPQNGANLKPVWSPDSRRIIYEANGPLRPTAGRELRMISLDDGKDQRVAGAFTPAGGLVCWSSDTESIVVRANTATVSRPEPMRVNLRTGEFTALFPGAASLTMTDCRGTLVAGVNSGSIRVRNIQTGAETEVYKHKPVDGAFGPTISHDGRSLLFLESLGENTSAVMTVPAGGGPARELARVKAPAELQPAIGYTWSPDDRFVYFLKRANANAPYELFRVPAGGGSEESMGLRGADLRDLDISPDGRRIAFSIGALGRSEIWAMNNFLPSGR